MKRFVVLVVALLLCVCAAAKEKTVSYKMKGGQGVYLLCQGNFDKGVLLEGPVSFYFYNEKGSYCHYYFLQGYYNSARTPSFEGIATGDNCGTLKCTGNIYNEKEQHAISMKSHTWYIDLKTEIDVESDIITDKAIIEECFLDERGVAANELNKEDNAFARMGKYLNSVGYRLFKTDGLNATVLLKNGNRYYGPIYPVESGIRLGLRNQNDFDCEYWWADGDYFKGTAGKIIAYDYNQNKHKYGIKPYSGVIKYADGTTDSSWSLPVEMNRYFVIDTTPTELREKTKELQAQKEREEREKEAAELRARQEKEMKKAQEAQEQEARRQRLINKYGAKYGNELAKGNLQLGMTKDMCKAVVNYETYDVVLNRVMNKVVETWIFNKDKQSQQLAGAMSQMSPEEAAMAALFLGMMDNMGAMNPKYTVLTFTDGKLTSLY